MRGAAKDRTIADAAEQETPVLRFAASQTEQRERCQERGTVMRKECRSCRSGPSTGSAVKAYVLMSRHGIGGC